MNSSYSLPALIPELANLGHYRPPISVYYGGQSKTHACRRVINDTLYIDPKCTADPDDAAAIASACLLINNSTLGGEGFPFYLNNDTSTPATQWDVYYAANHGTVCSSTNGSAPEVRISYRQCADTYFPGWERSELGSLSQWIGPLVQFILPCLAFCLSIPRSWKFKVYDALFGGRPSTIWDVIFFAVRLVIALFLVFLDTLVWLACCFAFAGPMLLSGLIEYMMDRKILEYLDDQGGNLRPETRTRLLLAVVAGNLRIAESSSPTQANGAGVQAASQTTTWDSVMRTVADQPSEWTILWLKTLLNTQMSFGSAVGAPIIFFIGGFIYNVIDAESSRGDEDTAEALAFGMWWMVIPHTAVIASAMLASNNPGAMRGMIGAPTRTGPNSSASSSTSAAAATDANGPWRRFLRWLFAIVLFRGPGAAPRAWEEMPLIEKAYDTGELEPVWVWDRGLNKRKWLRRIIDDLKVVNANVDPRRRHVLYKERCGLEKATRIGMTDMADIFSRMVVLLGAPFALAFATAYLTPQTGLGCRSITHLLYFVSQLAHIALWSWARTPYMLKSQTSTRAKAMRILWALCQILVTAVAVFSTIGGTLMQIIGVYRTCLCKVRARYWVDLTNPNSYAVLSDVTRSDVEKSKNWTYTGLAACGVLAVVAALGWWHQRRLRKIFQQTAEGLRVPSTQV